MKIIDKGQQERDELKEIIKSLSKYFTGDIEKDIHLEASLLHNAGYRKQRYVVKDVLEMLNNCSDKNDALIILNKYLGQKTKYNEQEIKEFENDIKIIIEDFSFNEDLNLLREVFVLSKVGYRLQINTIKDIITFIEQTPTLREALTTLKQHYKL